MNGANARARANRSMLTPAAIILALLILLVAALYSSVGHGGASGYLASMALLGVAPEVMKPASLVLNVLVSSIGSIQFARAGHFGWRLFWPFALASIPMALLGGYIHLPGAYYKPLIGAVLLLSAWRLAARPRSVVAVPRPPAIPVALGVGAAIGLLAGLSGTGGGIFLSPLLLLLGWASVKQTAAVSAVFILVNSLSGLSGLLLSGRPIPDELGTWLGPWALAAVVGGFVGSRLGARRLAPPVLRRLLAAALVVAGAKLILAR